MRTSQRGNLRESQRCNDGSSTLLLIARIRRSTALMMRAIVMCVAVRSCRPLAYINVLSFSFSPPKGINGCVLAAYPIRTLSRCNTVMSQTTRRIHTRALSTIKPQVLSKETTSQRALLRRLSGPTSTGTTSWGRCSATAPCFLPMLRGRPRNAWTRRQRTMCSCSGLASSIQNSSTECVQRVCSRTLMGCFAPLRGMA